MTDRTEAINEIDDDLTNKRDNMDSRSERIRQLQDELDSYSMKDRANVAMKSKYNNMRSSARDNLNKINSTLDDTNKEFKNLRHDLRNQLQNSLEEDISFEDLKQGRGKMRVGVLVTWTIISLVFCILTGLIYRASQQDSPATGLFVTVILLQFLNLLMVFLNKSIIGLIVSIVSFVLSLAFLIRSEENLIDPQNSKCVKDMNTYRIYIASHSFNIALLFFSLMRVLT